MKKSLFYLVFLLILSSSCKTQIAVNELANTITSEELKEMLFVYASDEYEGRETGKQGQKKAVEFIKKYYEELGVSPAVENSYFQNVPLQTLKTPEVNFSINDVEYNYYDDYISYTTAPSILLQDSQIVFAGYGIEHESYNSYENLDVNGKIVVVKGGEPKDKTCNYIVSGSKEISKWSNGRQAISSKRDAAKAHGAKALLMIDAEMFNRYSNYFKKQEERGGSNRLSLVDNNNDDIYFFLVNEKIGEQLVSEFSKKDTSEIVNQNIKIDYKRITTEISSENVVAYIKGSEKPDEYVVISAHLDHIGVNNDGEVYNGADDDGSGTVAIIEIAEAFQEAVKKGHSPTRSVVFLHVTGEEKGLLGSRYYTDMNPIFPLEATVANLNIDMIGRIDPKRDSKNRNYLYLIGSDKLSSELHRLSEEVNKKYTNIELDYKFNDEYDPNRFYYRSDHYNFAKNNIPVIFYFNGTHDDYHAVGDTPDKIEYDLLENRTKLVFYTAWEIANRKDRLEVDKVNL